MTFFISYPSLQMRPIQAEGARSREFNPSTQLLVKVRVDLQRLDKANACQMVKLGDPTRHALTTPHHPLRSFVQNTLGHG